jgi:mRNA-degrading endonuclease RelE of RelBE toxin-antitoxin system
MTAWRLKVTSHAARAVDKLPPAIRRRIKAAVAKLLENPRPARLPQT